MKEDSVEDPAAAAAVILRQEADRHELHAARRAAVVLPDDVLLGSDDRATLPVALRTGGVALLVVLSLLVLVAQFDRVGIAVLAPDIQRSLGVSDAALGAIAGAFGAFFVLGAIPIAKLADRAPRNRVAAGASALWAGAVLLTALVPSAFWLFVTRMATGLGESNTIPVHNAMLADAYPMSARGRVYGLYGMAAPIGEAIAPLLLGGIAAAAGGVDGWRIAFVVIAVPAAVLAVVVGFVKDPPRGRNEQLGFLGEELMTDPHPIPVSLGAAFTRLGRVRTFHFLLLGLGALGFALFSIPIFLNLLLRDHYDLNAWERGLFGAATVLPAVVCIPVAGWGVDRLFRAQPPRVLLLCGTCIAAFGAVIVLGLYMPNIVLLGVFVAIGVALSRAAFVALSPVVAAVVPYRLRSEGFAMMGIYIFLFGAFFGAVLTGILSEELGERVAITIVVIPSSMLGGAIIAYGARHIREDISAVVEELVEERDELRRVFHDGGAVPVLQVRNLDFSYGSLQVLFDVSLDVGEGEVVALLGTNGAGKSTLLRVVSGLGVPDRGVIRLDGRAITYSEAELRVHIGVVQVAGGGSTFGSLTVAETFQIATYPLRHDRKRAAERIQAVLDLFPSLEERIGAQASTLSGGEQQMLALAKGLVLEPRILLIDELSLGLAPAMVQQLLAVVEALKERGQTILLVEQSLNIALAIADRALFLEKGRVRFEGAARDLAGRDDLARAVFLGRDGG